MSLNIIYWTIILVGMQIQIFVSKYINKTFKELSSSLIQDQTDKEISSLLDYYELEAIKELKEYDKIEVLTEHLVIKITKNNGYTPEPDNMVITIEKDRKG